MIRPFSIALAMFATACGWQSTDPAALSADLATARAVVEPPPGAAPGSCWAADISPAVVETVTEQVLVQPAEPGADGTVLRPAAYRTETRQAIVRPRRETVFETPCPDVMTPDFIASLQRALKARRMYRSRITGVMDERTREAVRRYQKPRGLDSGMLSLATARDLGLVALDRKEFDG